MSDSDVNVLHVVGGDTPSTRLETLRVLYARPELGSQRVVQFGSGSVDCTGLGRVERLPAPLGVGWLARRCLRSAVPAPERTVIHVWSSKALNWVMPAAASEERVVPAGGTVGYRLLMDIEMPLDFRRLARGFSWLWSEGALRFVCPSDAARRRLVERGVPPDECVLIRDSVDFAAIKAACRLDVRSRLDLSAEHSVVLVLPPVLRETGALVAVWGAMLLGQVWPGVRLVVPDAGREVGRVGRLVESCRHGRMLRSVGRRFSLCELLAAADLAVYLPTDDGPLSGVAWALAAGKPIVASAVPATTELLAHGHNAWLCRPGDPKDAARRMLQALENQQQSQRQVELARSQVSGVFSRSGMVTRYRRAYENLLAGRRIADGIEEVALVR